MQVVGTRVDAAEEIGDSASNRQAGRNLARDSAQGRVAGRRDDRRRCERVPDVVPVVPHAGRVNEAGTERVIFLSAIVFLPVCESVLTCQNPSGCV